MVILVTHLTIEPYLQNLPWFRFFLLLEQYITDLLNLFAKLIMQGVLKGYLKILINFVESMGILYVTPLVSEYGMCAHVLINIVHFISKDFKN
jgi:hypothetical protein